jgi:tetratricopeptide (TPR) repeat protein
MGMNQLRTGAMEEGRQNLETAFEGDPYNPWFKNTLDLLDTFVHFETVQTEHFEIFIHEREVELLGPYAAATAEAAFSALRERYGAAPPTPIRLEIYPNHSDFSVRTLGHTGLGALGVSFGSTLVMDSPSAFDPGDFNWASTLWHEVAHAFHLAMSDHRVPRWFTEGLAVHEQHKARLEWGHRASPGWLQAYESGRLQPVSGLNAGFIRPEYPEQVVFSYFQASLVFDLVESRWGLGSILAMLDGYREGRSNAEVFREVLGQSPREFDRTFDEYVWDRWGTEIQAVTAMADQIARSLAGVGDRDLERLRALSVENPESFQVRLAYGQALYREERFDEAEEELRAALRLFPEYGGMDSPYMFLAGIHRERGELERAARAFQQLGRLNETLYPVHLEEAELWSELGDQDAAARALEKAVEIVPFDVDAHSVLAAHYEQLGEAEGAVRERRAILALDPVDRAQAHYSLAAALAEAGDRDEARRQVLRALEIAPTYEPALELLLKLRRGGGGEDQSEGIGGVGTERRHE